MEAANPNNFWHYNNRLKKFARENRKDLTKAEACIWKYLLSGRSLMGYQFRRQRPVLNYIADFMCKELMLIIEIDGYTHQFEHVAKNDIIRTKKLNAIGFTVLRFSDEEVLNDITNVSQSLCFYIEEFNRKNGVFPHPYPRQRGTLGA
jgi:very-short-patch-repair endonuclease